MLILRKRLPSSQWPNAHKERWNNHVLLFLKVQKEYTPLEERLKKTQMDSLLRKERARQIVNIPEGSSIAGENFHILQTGNRDERLHR
jgi:hypothetical protein